MRQVTLAKEFVVIEAVLYLDYEELKEEQRVSYTKLTTKSLLLTKTLVKTK